MAAVNTNLQLGIHLCQTSNCKTIKFSETTGEYNASSNPGGWSVPENATNPDKAKIKALDNEIKVLEKGLLFDKLDICTDEDSEIYSDIIYFKEGIKFAYAGISNWERVQ